MGRGRSGRKYACGESARFSATENAGGGDTLGETRRKLRATGAKATREETRALQQKAARPLAGVCVSAATPQHVLAASIFACAQEIAPVPDGGCCPARDICRSTTRTDPQPGTPDNDETGISLGRTVGANPPCAPEIGSSGHCIHTVHGGSTAGTSVVATSSSGDSSPVFDRATGVNPRSEVPCGEVGSPGHRIRLRGGTAHSQTGIPVDDGFESPGVSGHLLACTTGANSQTGLPCDGVKSSRDCIRVPGSSSRSQTGISDADGVSPCGDSSHLLACTTGTSPQTTGIPCDEVKSSRDCIRVPGSSSRSQTGISDADGVSPCGDSSHLLGTSPQTTGIPCDEVGSSGDRIRVPGCMVHSQTRFPNDDGVNPRGDSSHLAAGPSREPLLLRHAEDVCHPVVYSDLFPSTSRAGLPMTLARIECLKIPLHKGKPHPVVWQLTEAKTSGLQAPVLSVKELPRTESALRVRAPGERETFTSRTVHKVIGSYAAPWLPLPEGVPADSVVHVLHTDGAVATVSVACRRERNLLCFLLTRHLYRPFPLAPVPADAICGDDRSVSLARPSSETSDADATESDDSTDLDCDLSTGYQWVAFESPFSKSREAPQLSGARLLWLRGNGPVNRAARSFCGQASPVAQPVLWHSLLLHVALREEAKGSPELQVRSLACGGDARVHVPVAYLRSTSSKPSRLMVACASAPDGLPVVLLPFPIP
ncbi:hypothetical protein DIPPA_19497 [Diplonema papillatum]|nr:hypothetical protein DIPPA_19497 [Diplonema papillatum]